MKTIDKLEIILQKMEEQNNRFECIYSKHLKLIVCTRKKTASKFDLRKYNKMII